ncbi:MAG: TonB-dependent receptor [Bacteroidales bacterium]
MKNFKPFGELVYRSLKKTLMIMRFSIILLILGIVQAHANNTYSQKTRLSINFSDTELVRVLDKIEDESEFFFLYNEKLLDTNRKVSIDAKNQLIGVVLEQLFGGTDVMYTIIDRKIILAPEYMTEQSDPQLRIITGTVTDRNGDPLPGVNVFITGTNQGTSTNMAGKYSINVPAGTRSLTFSFVGMETKEAIIGDLTLIDVTMVVSSIGLEEVLVIGYGTVKKTDLTGSVASISKLAIKDRKVTTVNQALMGQMAGVKVEVNDATPGSVTSIRIRGTGSISAGNEPLYVIDGFPVGQREANQILPSDIESITVLKDASSTAIYGSRGANGVVIITTKSGANQAPVISFETSYGFAKVAKRDYYDLLNAQEYADYMGILRDEQWVRAGNDPSVPMANRPLVYQVPDAVKNRDKSIDTNWQDAIMEPASLQNYSVSVRGGNERTRYFYSMGYSGDNGVIIGSNYSRLTARLRLESDLIKNRLKAGINISPSFSKLRNTVTGRGDVFSSVIGTAIFMPPIIPVYNADGTYGATYGKPGLMALGGNPVQLANEYENKSTSFTNMLNSYLDLSILEGLNLKTSIGTVINNNDTQYFLPSTCWRPFAPPPTYADGSSSYGNGLNWLSETFLTYAKTFDLHKIDVTAGFTAQKDHATSNYLYSNKYPNNLVHTLNAATITSGNSNVTEWSMLSYLVRANYSFSDKYLLTATIRRDGSSRFGANVRYGTFPSVAAAWRVSQESFMENVKAISDLKIRASYGKTGNNDIGNYSAIGLVGITNQTFGLGSGTNYSGIYPSTLSNPGLSWESSKQFDIGLDLGLFNDRITFIFDFYNNHTSDLLLRVNLPTTTGFSTSLQNIGEVQNRGYEFSLFTKNTTGAFGWSTNFNISYNDNKVLKLGPNGDPIYDFYGTRITAVGYEIGASNGLHVIGILSQADIDAGVAIFPGEQAGDVKYEDVNKDGVISNFNGPDGINIGNSNSKMSFGLTNMFTFKNLDLTVFIHGQTGGRSTDLLGQGMWGGGGNNIWRSWLDNRYISDSQPGDGMTPRLTFGLGGLPDDRLVQKTDFIRIANITLGYTIPLKNTSVLSGLRAYISIENPATWDTFNGYNPQVKNNAQSATLGGFTLGGGYPLPRTISLGLNVTF